MSLLPTTVEGHRPHALHHPDQVWAETSCSLDLWIEVLHALGLEPAAAGASALAADMRGDQWLFLKYPIEDLRRLYGITVDELNIWRPMLEHVVDQSAAGRLMTVEVDSWYLPDTAGVAYRQTRMKSTIVPNVVDVDARRLEYFHNSGYHELSGADFDGVFGSDAPADSPVLPGYVEVVDIDAAHDADVVVAAALAREHLGRRAAGNPIDRFGVRLTADLPWLRQSDIETFHLYAFATVRQCGSTAQLAAAFLDWLTTHGETGLVDASAAFGLVAQQAKSLQFQLARSARGRTVDIGSTLGVMSTAWAQAMADVSIWAG